MGKKLAVAAVIVASVVLIAATVYNVRYTPLEPGLTADRVLLEKSQRRLTLLRDGKPLKTYRVSLGHTPIGKKQFEGDGKTPEGHYVIDFHKRDSSFHRALHISYPNAEDLAHAKAAGRPAGGDIMIHGLRNGLGVLGPLQRLGDWTQGCVAVTNAEIKELWDAIPDGTPIEIRP